MADRKLEDFVLTLARKSNEGKVPWERTTVAGVYQASFPNYYVRLYTREGQSGDEDYVVQVYSQDGELVDEIADVDFDRAHREFSPSPFEVMQQLYQRARRGAMGLDKALDDILSSLE